MKTRSSYFINGLRYHHIYPAKCHLVEISQLIVSTLDMSYITTLYCAAFWVCWLSFSITKLQVMRHGSITTVSGILKKKKCQNSV